MSHSNRRLFGRVQYIYAFAIFVFLALLISTQAIANHYSKHGRPHSAFLLSHYIKDHLAEYEASKKYFYDYVGTGEDEDVIKRKQIIILRRTKATILSAISENSELDDETKSLAQAVRYVIDDFGRLLKEQEPSCVNKQHQKAFLTVIDKFFKNKINEKLLR